MTRRNINPYRGPIPLLGLAMLAALTNPPLALAATKSPAPHVMAQDNYHGIVVEDHYRWLENWNDPQVRAWSDAQSARARRELDNLPGRPAIHERLTALMAKEGTTYSMPRADGEHLFFLRQLPHTQQPSLVWWPSRAMSFDNAPTVTLDLNHYDSSGGTSIDWYVPSPKGQLVAISLSREGSERGALHLLDSATGREVEPPIENVNNATAGGDLIWTPDGTGFFYTRYPRSTERPENELSLYQQVYFHRLGTAATGDRYELGRELPRTAEIRLQMEPAAGRVLAWVQNGDSGQFEFFLRDRPGAEAALWETAVHWRPLDTFNDGDFEARFDEHGDLLVLSWARAPRGKVQRARADRFDFRRADIVLPESDCASSHSFYNPTSPTLAVSAELLMLVCQVGGPSELRIYTESARPVPLAGIPLLAHVSSITKLSPQTGLFAAESYTQPLAWFRYDLRTHQSGRLPELSGSEGWPDARLERVFATSRDGTRVPISVLTLAGVPRRGVLLTAYGGYRAPMVPHFQPEVRLLLEQGIAFAVANVRGGSEFGEEWHRQGALTHKQNVFDDFIASSEFLRAHGYAPEGRLAITGASNGGLLMGAVMTQRPDLARVVISEVGIYDSLRNELDANGAYNILELGTVQNRDEFAALYAYSPYHRVRDGVRYPATLLLTGANDSRVNPMHSRKMLARLSEATTGSSPILLRTSSNTGHGGGTPENERIEQLTDEYAFLLNELGLTYSPTAARDRSRK